MMIYLASPYSHPDREVRQQRFIDTCTAAASIMSAGRNVYAPIAHGHPIAVAAAAAGLVIPTDNGFWRDHNRWFIARCSELCILKLDGWRESVGVDDEQTSANEFRKPVTFLEFVPEPARTFRRGKR